MIIDRLQEDMKAAMKSGDKPRLAVVRMLLSELKNARINSGADLDDAAEQKVLASYAKKAQFFALETPIEVSGKFTDFGVGAAPGGIFGKPDAPMCRFSTVSVSAQAWMMGSQ